MPFGAVSRLLSNLFSSKTKQPVKVQAPVAPVQAQPTSRFGFPSSATMAPPQDWNVKYPEFAQEMDKVLESPDRVQDVSFVWTMAPSTSHVHSFRYADDALTNKFIGAARGSSKGRSVLSVRFKPSGKRGITEYRYFFTDKVYGQTIFDLMKEAVHPGEVVHHFLIADKIPYENVF